MRKIKGRNKEIGAWILGMKMRFEYLKMEEIRKSGHRIRVRRENTVSCPPPLPPKEDWRDKEKEVKIIPTSLPETMPKIP